MHNDTPLGMTMHLKELDRQATSKSSALRPKAQRSWRGIIAAASSLALLRRACAVIRGTRSTGSTGSQPHDLQTFPSGPLS